MRPNEMYQLGWELRARKVVRARRLRCKDYIAVERLVIGCWQALAAGSARQNGSCGFMGCGGGSGYAIFTHGCASLSSRAQPPRVYW